MRKPTLDKNLLSVALGIYLSKERAGLPNSKSKEVAADIGISDSLYRMIETGSARIHPKYILDFMRVFYGSKIQFDAFAELIFLIQFLDSSTESYSEYHKALIELKGNAAKYNNLLESVEYLLIEVQKSKPKNTQDLENNITENIKAFLSLGNLYNKTQVEIQKSYPSNFFKNIPTHQMEIFEKIKEYVLQQPKSYTAITSWNWEKNNIKLFKNCIILDNQPEIITGLKNLTKYRYEYLWQPNFDKTCILFISDETSTKYKDLFKKNLKKALETLSKENSEKGDDAKEKLKNFDEIIDNKVEIKCISTEEDKLLAAKIFKATFDDPYNAAWVFSLENFFNVGVRAIVEGDDARLAKGDYLTFDDTLTILKELTDLWNKI